ncbi:hypothetical protein D3C83_104450 [compost metagenome]
MQNPMFGGGAGMMAYLPSKKVALALAVTFDEAAFSDETGEYKNSATDVLRAISTYLAPEDMPPAKR